MNSDIDFRFLFDNNLQLSSPIIPQSHKPFTINVLQRAFLFDGYLILPK